MEKEANFETSPLNTQDAKAEAATTLTLDATNGDKIKALRTAQHMSMAELTRRSSMSDRAIRYKTRNPEEIISQQAIKLKDIRFCHDLLGYYKPSP